MHAVPLVCVFPCPRVVCADAAAVARHKRPKPSSADRDIPIHPAGGHPPRGRHKFDCVRRIRPHAPIKIFSRSGRLTVAIELSGSHCSGCRGFGLHRPAAGASPATERKATKRRRGVNHLERAMVCFPPDGVSHDVFQPRLRLRHGPGLRLHRRPPGQSQAH